MQNVKSQTSAMVQTEDVNITPKAINMTKRIGSTTYKVAVHFSATSRETIDEKILRLIKNDAELRKMAVE